MSCLSVKDGVQVGPVPGNNVLGGDSPTQLPPRKVALQWGGGVSGVVTVSQLMQSCDSKWLKIAEKKWSTSNKRKAKGADLQIVTSCHCDLSSCFWTLLYDKVQVNLAKTVDLITVTRLWDHGCTITRSTVHNNSNCIFLQKVLYNHDLCIRHCGRG